MHKQAVLISSLNATILLLLIFTNCTKSLHSIQAARAPPHPLHWGYEEGGGGAKASHRIPQLQLHHTHTRAHKRAPPTHAHTRARALSYAYMFALRVQ